MIELKDMQYAISFCQEHDDPDLWNDLINHSLNKPGTTKKIVLPLLQRTLSRIYNFSSAKHWNLRGSYSSSPKNQKWDGNTRLEERFS